MRLAANLSRRTRSASSKTGSKNSSILGRKSTALLALPLSVALAMPLMPSVTAQSPLGGSMGPGSGTSYLDPDSIPKRTPRQVTEQNLQGLPEGVSVDRVEWITERWANVYINSAAMPGKPIKVQILLARDWYSQPDRKFPTVWALDGLRAREDESGWILSTNIASQYADRNVNVVLPVGGESSFYTDWQEPDNGKHYKWETFLTKELPAVLREGWRANEDRAITGLSMGGTAAMNLAERFPKMWKFVGSFSGYLDTTSYGMPEAIAYATKDGNGYDAKKMWGDYGSQDWIDHDPKLGVDALKDMTVYVSAGNGNAGKYDKPGSIPGLPANMAGFGLEAMSRMTTETFVKRAKKAGIKPITAFRPSGTHDWPYWQYEMIQAWPHIANALGIPEADRGARCKVGGAIAENIKNAPNVGACISNEYDAKDGGKVQDFRGGRAYWSPKTGAHFVWGRIGARYASMNGPESWLGYPTSEEHVIAGGRGRFTSFENGAIYWTAETGAFAVPKDFIDEWGKTKWENGPLGFPIADVEKVGDSYMQKFQNGVIVRNKDNKTNYVQGKIAEKYLQLGGVTSKLGNPTSGELAIKGGRFTQFEHGNIYWSPTTGAHVIYYGNVFDEWGKNGWEQGKLGYPTSDHEDIPAGGTQIKFQHGEIREVNGRVEVR